MKKNYNKMQICQLQHSRIWIATISVILLLGSLPTKSQIYLSQDTFYAGENISFQYQNSNIASNVWNFGDGNTSSLATAIHTYAYSSCGIQSYNIVLNTIDSANIAQQYQKTIWINSNPPKPQLQDVDFITPFNNCDNSPSLSNSNFSISLNNITSDTALIHHYTVDWGDNSTVQTISNSNFPISHTYTQLGLFLFTITSYNVNGCSSSTTYEIANQSNPAIGLSSLGSTQGCAPQSFTFILSQYQNNSPGTYYVWDFGDGSPQIVWNYNDPYLNDSIQHIFSATSCNTSNHTFTVSVTAHNYCDQTTATVGNIRIYTSPSANFVSSADTSCLGSNIQFTNNTQSGFGYNCNGNANYQWDFGDGTLSSSTNASHIFNQSGQYWIKLSASNGVCGSSKDSSLLVINEQPIINVSLNQNTSCDSLTTAISNQSTGGNLKYLWSVSPNTGWNLINGSTLNDPEPQIQFHAVGQYNLQLHLYNNCGYADSSIQITIQSKPTIQLTSIGDFCDSAIISPSYSLQSNYTTNLSYSWQFSNAQTASTNVSHPQNILFNQSGNQKIKVQVSNVCGTDLDSTYFEIFSSPLVQINNAPNYICQGDSIHLQAVGAANYQWTAIGNIGSLTNASLQAVPTQSSYYKVIGTDSHQCFGKDSVFISMQNLPNIQIVANKDSLCFGDSISLNATGGSSYNWFANSSLISQSNGFHYAPSQSASIILKGIDSLQCENRDTLNYTVFQRPQINLNSSQISICKGDSFLLQASGANYFQMSGGNFSQQGNNFMLKPSQSSNYVLSAYDLASCNTDTTIQLQLLSLPNIQIQASQSSVCIGDSVNLLASGAQNYQWFSQANPIGSTSNITQTIQQNSEFIVVGSDQNNCVYRDTIHIQALQLPNLQLQASQNSICLNDSIYLSANPNLALKWFKNGSALSTANQLLDFPTSTTQYQLKGIDSNQCSNMDSIQIQVYNLPQISVQLSQNQICIGDSALLQLSGAQNFWLNGNPISSSYVLQANQATNYTVIGKDIHNCVDTTQFTLQVNPLPNIQAQANKTSICLGQSINLSATGGVQYQWSPSSNLNAIQGSQITATPNQNTLYFVEGIDSKGCKNIDSIGITVSNTLNFQAQASQSQICYGDSVILTASNASTYVWQGGNGLQSTNGNSVIAHPTSSSTFVVTATDSMGCIATQAIPVQVYNLPNVQISSNSNSICPGDSLILSASGASTYQWSNQNQSLSNNAQLVLFPNQNTNYTVQGTDVHGCQNTNSIQISMLNLPTISFNASSNAICLGDSIQVSANGGTSYTWESSTGNFLMSGQSISLIPNQSQWLKVQVINAQGCETRDSIHVQVHPLPSLQALQPNPEICYGDSILLQVSSNAQVSWFPSQQLLQNQGYQVVAFPQQTTQYTIVAQDMNGCQNSIQQTLYVRPLPITNFHIDSVLCKNSTTTISNQSTGANLFHWTFSDGTTSNQATPTKSFANEGFYSVKLKAESAYGCKDSISMNTHVIDAPIAGFQVIPISGCSPVEVYINDSSNVYNGSYSWTFGNGQTYNLAQPSNIQYTVPKGQDSSFVIHLQLTNMCGSSDAFDTIDVFSKPDANFGYTLNTQCSPVTASFGNITSANATSYFWNFGDTTYSTQFIPNNHIYTTAGNPTTYAVQLIASNNCGSDTAIKYINVNPNYVHALFTPSQVQACAPATISFANFSNIQNMASWSFGDGNVSSQISPTHIYPTAGNYQVQLVVTDNCGIDTLKTQIQVGNPPNLNISLSNDTICQYQSLNIQTNSSNLTNIQWELGDSSSSNLANFQHIYQQYGNFEIQLIGEDATSHCSDTVSTHVEVNPSANAIFATDTLSGCYPLQVNFTNQSTNANFIQWDFDDGNTSIQQNVLHNFTNPNNYYVKLIANNYFGCSDTTYSIIKAYPRPTAIFSSQNTNPCGQNANIAFQNNSTGAIAYHWDFGDNSSSGLNNPNHIYQNFGTYTIRLNAYNSYGCSDSTYTNFNFDPLPIAKFSVDKLEACENEDIHFTNQSLNAQSSIWLLDQSTVLNTTSPTYAYTNSGHYHPTLIAIGQNNCSDTLVLDTIINVHASPKVAFDWHIIPGTKNTMGSYQFVNQSQDADQVQWDFDDGSTSTDESPIHRFMNNNEYQITLYASNKYNCSSQLSKYLKLDMLKGLYIPNALAPNHPNPAVRLFTPKGKSLSSYHLAIYDSWGNLLWETSKLVDGEPAESWNGSSNNVPLPQGTYFWQVRAVFDDGTIWQGMDNGDGTLKREGVLTLLR